MEEKLIRVDAVAPLNGTAIDVGPIRCHGAITPYLPVPLKVDVYPAMQVSAVHPAQLNLTTLARLYEFQPGTTMNTGTLAPMPTTWMPGSAMVPYIQFCIDAAGAGFVRWTLQTRITTDGIAAGAITTNTVDVDVSTWAAYETHTIAFPSLSAVGMVAPCTFAARVTRDGLNDTFGNNALLVGTYVITSANAL